MKMIHELNKRSILDNVLCIQFLLSLVLVIVFIIIDVRPSYYYLFILILMIIQLLSFYCAKNFEFRYVHTLFPIVEYVLILIIFFGSDTGIEGIVLVIFTIKIILLYPSVTSVILSELGYLGYLLLWESSQLSISNLIISIVSYSLLIASVLGGKLLLKQRDTIINLNRIVMEQSTAMERMAKIKERGRIAEEMHNTLGHTLTTAIVSLEGADVLFENNPGESHRRIRIAKEQLRNGLNDIRHVVKHLNNDLSFNSDMSLRAMIEQMIQNLRVQTSINIELDYMINIKLLSLQNYVLYNVVKESITNAIKHASAEKININIQQLNELVLLEISNDGKVPRGITPGFGLTKMSESVEAIGGKLDYFFDTSENGVFKVCVYLPIVQEVFDGEN